MKSSKAIIVITLIGLTMLVSFALPRPKYESPDILSKLEIPASFGAWRSRDASSQVQTGGDVYNFVSRVFAREYARPAYISLLDKGYEGLLFLILGAGNFHNPKVCYGSSGYKTTDLPDIEFDANGHRFKASAVFFDRPGKSVVITYWIVIDKKQAGWGQQKIIELWSSLLGKKKAGFMCRIDIPATADTTDKAVNLAKSFISAIAPFIPQDQAEYLFGK
ncbi:MAG: exosortase C-terminal domain/associated protein EpsI [Candidatus Omnitrophota bacterium]|jgi:hypothetical protein